MLDNLGSFFRLDHQVDIGLDFMEVVALRYSRESIILALCQCAIVSPISILTTYTLNQFHLMEIRIMFLTNVILILRYYFGFKDSSGNPPQVKVDGY